MTLKLRATKAVGIINEAVSTRKNISELYKQYNALTAAAVFVRPDVKHSDLKRASDALYYLGGGWPTEKSRGRMEALLDDFSAMYRILDFIGSGNLVTAHLLKLGITIKLDRAFEIENSEVTPAEIKFLNSEYNSELFGILSSDIKDTRDLFSVIIMALQELQGEICFLADSIKLILKPQAKSVLGIENEEYDRLRDFLNIKSKPQSKTLFKKTKIDTSLVNYRAGLVALSELSPEISGYKIICTDPEKNIE